MAEPAYLRPEQKFHPDPARSYTLPARYYTDPDVFEREKVAIYFRTWQYVCHVEELADVGHYVTHEILDQSIAIVRGKNDELWAFCNVCSHRAHRLLDGKGTVTAKTMTCPYHAWAYRLDGSLRSARAAKGSRASIRTNSACARFRSKCSATSFSSTSTPTRRRSNPKPASSKRRSAATCPISTN